MTGTTVYRGRVTFLGNVAPRDVCGCFPAPAARTTCDESGAW